MVGSCCRTECPQVLILSALFGGRCYDASRVIVMTETNDIQLTKIDDPHYFNLPFTTTSESRPTAFCEMINRLYCVLL